MRSTLIATSVLVFAAVRSAAAATPFQELEQARREFRSNNFAVAVPLLKDLVYPEPRLGRPDELLEVHVLLGSCEYEMGNRNDARDEFEKALAIQPDFQLDTLLYSTGAVKLFDDTKAEVTARAKADDAQRKTQAELEKRLADLANLRLYEVTPLIVNFVPFGIGQVYNNERKRVVLFAVGEGLTFATSAGIWAYLVGEYGYNGRVPPANAADVRHLQQLEIGAGIGFFAFYAWGVVDSLLHYNHRTQIQPDDLPPSLRPSSAPLPKTSLRDRLHVGPLVLPSGLGVGLSLEN